MTLGWLAYVFCLIDSKSEARVGNTQWADGFACTPLSLPSLVGGGTMSPKTPLGAAPENS